MVNAVIVGATGIVGSTILEILQQKNFPIKNLYLVASQNSVGKAEYFHDKILVVESLDGFDFSKVDIAFFTAGGAISKKYAPIAAKHCVVIDNTSEFRQDKNVPLIVPEVNLLDLSNYTNTNIISNPNCSTIQMLLAIQPIYKLFGIKKINVTTYQSVSGAGQRAITELVNQLGELLNGRGVDKEVFEKQIAFNVLPMVDVKQENDYSKEEMKMILETRKILDSSIEVNATTVRVPVIYGHSEAIHIETHKTINMDILKNEYHNTKNVELFEEDYPTSLDILDNDNILVGRLRKGIFSDKDINLWAVGNNIRKGGALNSVQIAEELVNNYLYTSGSVAV